MADLDALRSRFARALAGAATHGPAPDTSAAAPDTSAAVPDTRAAVPDPAPYADDLLARWQEPQRHYHTLAHLTAVLDHVDALAQHADDVDVVRLAAWFHDAVYRPDRSENEERSARLAERALPEAGVPAARTAEVARLVRLTVTHAPAADDRDGQVLCDADLAILASPPSAYAAYTAAVREEYHFVPNDAFREGRAAILRQLLDLPSLFHTPHGRREWEATARHNLTGELEMLSLPDSPGL
ncbi:HD domain-containing protein [Streptomyces tendae]|uniref:HD domain-containing protein n=1 Tax=Streptomyces tendae TaxID=1932 RepID=UPI0037123F15